MGFCLHLVGGFPKGILQGRVAPAWPNMRGALPLCTPPWVGLPAPHPGFLSFHDERNQRRARTYGSGLPQCEVSALFALAYASRRAAFCHCRRGICHFEVVRGIGCAVALGFEQEKYSAFNPWRRGVLVARLDATLGAIRGIGEGGFWKRTGNEVAETEGTEGNSIQQCHEPETICS